MCRLPAGLCLLIAFAVGLAVPAHAAPEGFAGMNAQWVFWGAPATWDAHLAAMAAGGVQTVRFDATWASAEPAPPVAGRHAYVWSGLDAVAGALARHGLRWQPILSYSALWASSQPGDEHAPPADPAAYAAFAGAFAARYGEGGSFWAAHPDLRALPVRAYEIWNEENLSVYWRPAPDAGAYADLYAAARDAIHAVQPSAQAIVGGLSPGFDPPKFVEAMLAHRPDLRGHLDAVAIHPYAADAAAALALVVRLRLGLQYLGSGDAPIVVSEFGWTTNGAHAVSDAWRAGQVAQLTRDLARSDCGVSAVQLHTWVRPELLGDAEDGYGVVHPDGGQTQTAVDYLATLRDIERGAAGPPLQACWPDAPAAPTSTAVPSGSEAAPPAPNAQSPTPNAPATKHATKRHKHKPKCKRTRHHKRKRCARRHHR